MEIGVVVRICSPFVSDSLCFLLHLAGELESSLSVYDDVACERPQTVFLAFYIF